MDLPANIQSEVDELFDLNETAYEAGEFELCIALHKQAWSLFPEPRYRYHNEGYALVQGLVDLNLRTGDLSEAEYWARELEHFDQNEFLGTTEFALGKVYYALNRMEEAKELFEKAMQQSDGRTFVGEDGKYLAFLKNPG